MRCTVVYKLNCSDCGSSYIGETCRTLSVRLAEHQKDSKSAVFEHCAENGHTVDWGNASVLNVWEDKFYRRKYMEAIQIKRHGPKLNRDTGLYIPRAYDTLIKPK